ncbi:MAG: PLP-dependent aminotransferase family protein [Spirochaetales bacterium]|nr:PLP-dependent aminotransferase family protein [Spirochaetales bacterium]
MKFIVPIQLTDNGPKYLQIAGQIEQKIKDGELQPGDKLPPIRHLAGELSVNTITIVKAYEQLQGKGLVTKIKGSGVYVGALYRQSPKDHTHAASRENAPEAVSSDLNNDELYLDDEIELMQRGSIVLTKEQTNFATSTPTSDLFPVKAFKQALNIVLDRDGGAAFEYDVSNGYLPLREQVSTLLKSRYGIITPADRLQTISGAQQGIDIAAKALIKPGDRVLVEDPTYTGALAVFKSRGAQIVGIPMESDGINIEYLEKSMAFYKPKVLYLMPDYQNPTTCSYSSEKRQVIIDIAHQFGCYIIEDDYLSDLTFSTGERSKPLKTYDWKDDERVIYIKSFSKLLMPGLRIGFLAAPGKLSRDILQAKHLTDIASSGLIQRAFASYLHSGDWEQHLDQMRDLFRRRLNKLLEAVRKHLPTCTHFETPKGGFNLWVPLPQGIRAVDVYKAAAHEGVLCTPGNVFRAGNKDHDDHLRLSIAAVADEQIDRGIKTIAQVLHTLQTSSRSTDYISPLM